MKVKYLSLAARNALIYFVLFILGLSSLGYLLFSYSSKEILNLTEANLNHSAEMVRVKFENYVDNLESDINQLGDSPLLDRFLIDTNAIDLELLNREYVSFLNSKMNYFQVRLLDESSGLEMIRVERSKRDSVFSAEANMLQNKGDRDYFQEIQQLPKDSVYFSKIDLNREYGEISTPVTPTLRIAKHLKQSNGHGFIIILNVDLTEVFNNLRNSIPNSYELRLFDQDGHYLIHPNKSQEFTFDYDWSPGYWQEYELKLDAISKEGTIAANNKEVSEFLQLDYSRPNYAIYLIVTAQKKIVFSSFYIWRTKVILALIGIALIFLLIAFIYMRKQVKELKTITNQLTLFSSQPQPHKLPIDRKDEIGELARGFEKMSIQISESHELINTARKEAEQAYQEKNEFLENMSHEIRNPLQAIIGTIEILEQNKLDKSQDPFVNSLRFSAIQLRSLVTDVLDYGKIKKHQITLLQEWTNLDKFCQDLMKGLSYQALSKNISLEYLPSKELLGANYLMDRKRIYQIVNNLITNALKFTEDGGEVVFKISPLTKANDDLQFEIIDSGAGILPEDLENILNRSVTSNYRTGTGLGLSIVQELLLLHKSHLQIESNPGKGSRFFFHLKMKREETTQTNEVEFANIDFNEFKVLVIEDDPVQTEWYDYALKKLNPLIINHPTKLDNKEKYHLIISDLNFSEPQVEIEALCASYQSQLFENGTVLFVSGEKIRPVGDNEYCIQKPVDKTNIWEIAVEAFVKSSFGAPNFDGIIRDYDEQLSLVKNAINVLSKEWGKEQIRIVEAVLNRDKEKMAAINHKINTSIRRLRLTKFESYLSNIESSLTKVNEEVLKRNANTIRAAFSFYLNEFEKFNRDGE